MKSNEPDPQEDAELTTALRALAQAPHTSQEFHNRVMARARQVALLAEVSDEDDPRVAATLRALASEVHVSPAFHEQVMARVAQQRLADIGAGIPVAAPATPATTPVRAKIRAAFTALRDTIMSRPLDFKVRLKDVLLVGATAGITLVFTFFSMQSYYESSVNESVKNEGEKILIALREYYEKNEKLAKDNFSHFVRIASDITGYQLQVPEEFSVYVVVDESYKEGQSVMCGKDIAPSELVWLTFTHNEQSNIDRFLPKKLDRSECQRIEEDYGIRPQMPILKISKYDSIRMSGQILQKPELVNAKVGSMEGASDKVLRGRDNRS